MKGLIIGKGQVGTSLYDVLKDVHETHIKDIEELELPNVEILHLCFPYSDQFVETANSYIEKYKPEIVINHASVAIGTTRQLKHKHVFYSPVRGKHPNLADGIRQFVKFVAGDVEYLPKVVEYFNKANVLIHAYDEKQVNALEFCKLMSNIRYGYEICFMQEAERMAKYFNIDIDKFKTFEMTYNLGYDKTGEAHLKRPQLTGGIIGGHCIMQNLDIITKQYTSEMADWMYFSNNKRKVELEKVLTILKTEG